LPAALAAVRAGKTLALANKESLVVAGSLLIPEARRHGVTIIARRFRALRRLPGHALRQSPSEVRRVILTASGGPFRQASAERLRSVTSPTP
jgi:1-deoxy-D-xylulose-5-phosphate reductoisomerase